MREGTDIRNIGAEYTSNNLAVIAPSKNSIQRSTERPLIGIHFPTRSPIPRYAIRIRPSLVPFMLASHGRGNSHAADDPKEGKWNTNDISSARCNLRRFCSVVLYVVSFQSYLIVPRCLFSCALLQLRRRTHSRYGTSAPLAILEACCAAASLVKNATPPPTETSRETYNPLVSSRLAAMLATSSPKSQSWTGAAGATFRHHTQLVASYRSSASPEEEKEARHARGAICGRSRAKASCFIILLLSSS
jgi:hypothetical protein